eukprot:s374_g20.t1
MKKVVLFAQDDHAAAECLVPLTSNYRVLGVGHGATTSIFARRCVELGFAFANALEDQVVAGAMEKFQPDLTVLVPDLTGDAPGFAFAKASGTARNYVVKVGQKMTGAPWPEFAPIWLKQDCRVSICRGGEEVGAEVVPVGKEETALSLRAKHALVAARLLKTLLEDGEGALPKLDASNGTFEAEAPKQIDLKWDEDSTDRFIRGSLFPPHDPAVVEVPGKGETYFIESMEQFNDFRMKVLEEAGTSRGDRPRSYAADTHWYSNVGGSIVKMGDSDIHMPLKTSEKKHKAIIPGAALGARKKLRMNEPLIGPNAERYCSAALASGWIAKKSPACECGCEVSVEPSTGRVAMGGGASKVSGPKLSNLLTGQSKADRDDFDRAFAKFPPTPSRTWGFQVKNEALYANDSWLSTQKRIRMSDINRLLGLRPYPGKPAGGKVRDLDIINMVWGNPQWIDPDEDQNYNLTCAVCGLYRSSGNRETQAAVATLEMDSLPVISSSSSGLY